DVRVVPDRRPAGVHAHESGLERLEDLLRAGERVVQPQRHVSTSATAWAAIPSPAPSEPMPSGDVAFTLTEPGSRPRACARLRAIASRCCCRRGDCAIKVLSTLITR